MVGLLGRLHEHKWPVRAAGEAPANPTGRQHVKIHVDLTGLSARRLISAGDKIAVDGQIIRNKPGPVLGQQRRGHFGSSANRDEKGSGPHKVGRLGGTP